MPYEDRELEQLGVYAKHLHPLLRIDRPQDDVSVGELQFLTGIAQRISRQEDVMAQVNTPSVEQVMHGLFPKRVLDTVLDAMTDHEELSLEVLDNETKGRAFALVILKMLTAAGGLGQIKSGAEIRLS